MTRNSFGTLLRLTTFGESHGPAIGCILDGCPAGLFISLEEIQKRLDERRPGHKAHVSPRKESDQVELLSGVFDGKTTGAPIMLLIRNQDADSSSYEPIKEILRPGHANYTYLEKYGHFDFRGGGRASARETAARVAAGSIAEQFLQQQGIQIKATLVSVGGASTLIEIEAVLERCIAEKESVGGVVECIVDPIMAGLGDPVYEKIEAKLAAAMMGLPGTKAFEIGEGVQASCMKGSEHNDLFYSDNGSVKMASNHAGGTLGGITTGAPLSMRVHFKPTSSIGRKQESVDIHGKPAVLELPGNSRHDPCIAVRAVPVVKAMCALVVMDCFLLNRTASVCEKKSPICEPS